VIEIEGAQADGLTALPRSWLPVTTMILVPGQAAGSAATWPDLRWRRPGRAATQIEQHDCRFEAAQLRQRGFAVAGDQHFVVVQAPFDLLLQADIVFNQQNFRGFVVALSFMAGSGD
jgi:hypothetical protein